MLLDYRNSRINIRNIITVCIFDMFNISYLYLRIYPREFKKNATIDYKPLTIIITIIN